MNGKISKMPSMYIEFEVRDKDGKIIQKGRQKAHSWTGNIIRLLSAIFYGPTSIYSQSMSYCGTRTDLVDTSNSARPVCFAYTYLGSNAGAGQDSFGIVVGSSDAPVTLDQYALQAKIANGSSAGQLLYNASTIENLTVGTTYYFRVIRTFSNNSGGTITVKEIGLYVQLPTSASSYSTYMFARDVIASGISVPNGSVLTLRYIISYSLS